MEQEWQINRSALLDHDLYVLVSFRVRSSCTPALKRTRHLCLPDNTSQKEIPSDLDTSTLWQVLVVLSLEECYVCDEWSFHPIVMMMSNVCVGDVKSDACLALTNCFGDGSVTQIEIPVCRMTTIRNKDDIPNLHVMSRATRKSSANKTMLVRVTSEYVGGHSRRSWMLFGIFWIVTSTSNNACRISYSAYVTVVDRATERQDLAGYNLCQ